MFIRGCRHVIEVSFVLEYDAASMGNLFSTFRDIPTVTSSRIENVQIFLEISTLE
jgi:hypothetical protein